MHTLPDGPRTTLHGEPRNDCEQRLLFIGAVVPPDEVHQTAGVSNAGNLFQFGLLSALADRCTGSVSCASFRPEPMWKGSGRIYVKGRRSRFPNSLEIAEVPFVNVLVAKQICIALGVFLACLRWGLLNRRAERRSIVVYNTNSITALPGKLAAFLTRSRFVCLIADVPDTGVDHPMIKRVLLWPDNRIRWRMVRHCDALITLTRQLGKDLGAGRPFLVVEGGVGVDAPQEPYERHGVDEPPKIVHVGSLGYLSGIEIALDSFKLLSTRNAQLHVYGSGPLAQKVEELAAANPQHVFYHGHVEHGEALKAQREACVLLCPRIPDGTVTPYTFPSKLYEYLLSGVPVVANRLEGIPDESVSCYVFPTSATPDAWAKSIDEVLADTDGSFRAKALHAREFVTREKNWKKQAERVSRFLLES